jgi:branched-chain amino acid transport system ATP-binding protein
MLELASLSRVFGGLVVIDRLDFKVEPGEIVGILGPNGAGKTTLFNMIAGVLPPSAGRILFANRDITAMKAWDRCRLGIGRTYQILKPFTHMSVFEMRSRPPCTVVICPCRRRKRRLKPFCGASALLIALLFLPDS